MDKRSSGLKSPTKLPTFANDTALLEAPTDELHASSEGKAFLTSFESFFFKEALSSYLEQRQRAEEMIEGYIAPPEPVKKAVSNSNLAVLKKQKRQPWLHVDEWKVSNTTLVSDDESDSEELLPSELCKKLGIDGEDSPWYFDDSSDIVVLKNLPEAIRIPVPLFETLYPHQRSGIQWLAELRLRGVGGILGE
eukprot:CAMPEP_0178785496 /NCGR_PEP_ID=MMETSP0745-20121128/4814_1 /TAXON_ID=913974 /ORGANISM="Nitzschia punctata, Strain CCMP561" /LENGTH=192 /DNA_ID=CAMNT_0020443207 /DNA_START=473 /DNA_END=1051 /DNA_ORIENTATION=+